MTRGVLLLLLAASAAAYEPSFQVREVKDARDASAVNREFRELSGAVKSTSNDLDTAESTIETLVSSASSVHSRVSLLEASVSTFTFQIWARFIGTGTYAIEDGVGVTSITRIATGDYRINFSTPFSGAYFSATCTVDQTASAFTGAICGEGQAGTRTGQSARIQTYRSDSTQEDAIRVNFIAVGRR